MQIYSGFNVILLSSNHATGNYLQINEVVRLE